MKSSTNFLVGALCLSITLVLTACGGGGGGSNTPASSQPVSSLVVSSSSTQSVFSTASSIAPRSSSSSSASEPTHASNGALYCTAAGDDGDGDGWGWENDASCIVRNSGVDPDKGNFQGCIIGTTSVNYCISNSGSWGYENGKICIANNFCPANRSNTQTSLSENLVDPEASVTAESVYDYLRSIWGTKTLSGQQDLTWKDDIDMYQRVVDETGEAPAIMGYDYMNFGLGGAGQKQTDEAIAQWNRGGLVTFSWHWRDPLATGAVGSREFYSAKTNFQIPIRDGQLDVQSPAFVNMQRDIDLVAGELKKLQDLGVPVLWRPLHEASGGWFWWGRARNDGVPPAYAQALLWRHIFDRMVNHHGLHNLIWVWNGQSAAWYPGDAYVDIVSQDIYDGARNYESQIDTFTRVKKFPLQTKLVALSENSNIPDPDLMAADDARWLWFMVWNDWDTAVGVTGENNFWTGEYYNTNAHKIKVYNHDNVITLDELPDSF